MKPRVFAGVAAVALLATACGAAAVSNGTTTSSTSTTTTTLPTPVEVLGSAPVGSLSSIGPIFRVPIVPVSDGQALPTPLASGSVGLANRLRIGYRQIGSGPDLVLIMGEHGTMSWWDPQLLQALAGSYTVTIFDLPGVGYSEYSPTDTSLDAFADVTAGFIAALGLKQPIVLGWGLGGQVALALAERHPGVATRLVLVNSGPGGTKAAPVSRPVAALLSSPYVTMAQLSELLFTPDFDAARTAWLGRIAQIPSDDIVASGIAEESAIEAASFRDNSVSQGLSKIGLPTLVVFGDQDDVFPAPDSLVLARTIPHAKRLELSGGYGAIFADPTIFTAALTKFTNGQ